MSKESRHFPPEEYQLINSIQDLLQQSAVSPGGIQDKRIDRYLKRLAELREPRPLSLSEFKTLLSQNIQEIASLLPD